MNSVLKFIFKLLGNLFESKQPYIRNVESKQPYIRNVRNKKLINYWWSEVFYSPDYLKKDSRWILH